MRISSAILISLLFLEAGCSRAPSSAPFAGLPPATRLEDLPPCPTRGSLTSSELLALLREGRFGELDEYIQARQEGFEADAACEQDVWYALLGFSEKASWIGRAVDRWVDRSPDSFAAHTVRGVHWSEVGRNRRGTRWAKDVTAEQWAGTYEAYDTAIDSLARSIALRPQNFVAYNRLIDIGMVAGSRHDGARTFVRAVEMVPQSFRVWAAAVDAVRPRWGGSYAQMRAMVRGAQEYVDRNPKIHWLHGREHWERAAEHTRAKRYEEAYASLEAAFRFADHTSWYEDLAYAAYRIGKHEEAVRAAEVYVGRGYHEKWTLVARGRSLRELGRHEESVDAMRLLVEHFPNWKWSHFEAGLSLSALERWQEIEPYWRRSVEMDPDWIRGLQSLCTLLLNPLGRAADALPIAKQMVEVSPEYAPGWFWYAESLYRSQPEDPRVAGLYGRYLELIDPEKEYIHGGSERAREILGLLGPPARLER